MLSDCNEWSKIGVSIADITASHAATGTFLVGNSIPGFTVTQIYGGSLQFFKIQKKTGGQSFTLKLFPSSDCPPDLYQMIIILYEVQ